MAASERSKIYLSCLPLNNDDYFVDVQFVAFSMSGT